MKLRDQDLRIDVFTDRSPEVGIRIIHLPTGFVVSGIGESRRALREKLVRELEELVYPQEGEQP